LNYNGGSSHDGQANANVGGGDQEGNANEDCSVWKKNDHDIC
jgi:hypothetical protein